MAAEKAKRRHEKFTGSILSVSLEDGYAAVENIFKALASERRLRILSFLTNRTASVLEIAAALDMPNSTATMHINILKQAGLVQTELEPANRGVQKICYRVCDQLLVRLPRTDITPTGTIDVEMPLGAYADCQIEPTCGLAGETGVIGQFDDTTSFFEPERIHAQLLWFKTGYVEYRFPNRLLPHTRLDSLQVSLEICSEAPMYNDDWPSDITMWINGVEIGTWTSPGDFGGQRGRLTPEWWEDWSSQYGLLKMWKVNHQGTYIDGEKASAVTLHDLNVQNGDLISMRIGVKRDAANIGGINIFGKHFGNHAQGILMRLTHVQDERRATQDQ